jgi:outer membrane receptor for ferrienterochelin and colicins
MVAGFWMSNIAISKNFNKSFQLQAGIENLFNYTNAQQLPHIAGRLLFVNINYAFNKK